MSGKRKWPNLDAPDGVHAKKPAAMEVTVGDRVMTKYRTKTLPSTITRAGRSRCDVLYDASLQPERNVNVGRIRHMTDEEFAEHRAGTPAGGFCKVLKVARPGEGPASPDKDNDGTAKRMAAPKEGQKDDNGSSGKEAPGAYCAYKIVVAPPGPLGVAVRFTEDKWAVVDSIQPSCSFRNEIAVGDCIATINGRRISKKGDFNVGKDAARQIGIASKRALSSLPLRMDGRPVMELPDMEQPHVSHDTSGHRWERMLFELVLFQSKNGGSSIIPTNDNALRGLAEWATKERLMYTAFNSGRGVPSDAQLDRFEALRRVGFVFEAFAPARAQEYGPFFSAESEATFDERCEELVRYRRNNNNSDPIATTPLGAWMSRQRMAHRDYRFLLEKFAAKYPDHRPLLPEEMPRRGANQPRDEGMCRNHMITQRRIDKLNGLDGGFDWRVEAEGKRGKNTPWAQRVEEYKAFVAEHGHDRVPRESEQCPGLSKWIAAQRRNYAQKKNGKPSPLTAERIEQLKEAGFVFEGKRGRRAKSADEQLEQERCNASQRLK